MVTVRKLNLWLSVTLYIQNPKGLLNTVLGKEDMKILSGQFQIGVLCLVEELEGGAMDYSQRSYPV